MTAFAQATINMDDPQNNSDHTFFYRTRFQRLNILKEINFPKKHSRDWILNHTWKCKTFIKTSWRPRICKIYFDLEKECQLELFSNPVFEEMEDSFGVVSDLLRYCGEFLRTEILNMVTLFAEIQESGETETAFISSLRIKVYKIMGYGDKKKKEDSLSTWYKRRRPPRLCRNHKVNEFINQVA